MATIYTITTSKDITHYYANITIKKNRIRRYLGLDPETAKLALKKLEYELIFNPPKEDDNKREITLDIAILSFLKEVEASGVSYHRVKTIRLKLNALKSYTNKSLLNQINLK